MKRLFYLLVTCLMLTLLIPARAEAAVSGTCGQDLTWTLDDAGVLTISGTGAMTDYLGGNAPWFDYQNQITAIVLEPGITRIGNYAFNFTSRSSSVELVVDVPYGVTSIGENSFSGEDLVKITLPDSLKTIEDGAFGFWCGQDGINIPESVTEIGAWAFESCRFTSVTIPSSVSVIREHTFLNCSNLAEVTLSSGVTRIEDSAFQNCDSLTRVNLPETVTYLGASVFFDCEGLESVKFTGDAPEIAPEYVGAIFDRSMTAYYPAGNPTWNSFTLQDYNYETTTWIAYSDDAHTFGQPEFVWQDNFFECSAVFGCADCGTTVSLACQISQDYQIPYACRAGKVTYTAHVNLDGGTYTDVREVPMGSQELVPHTPKAAWNKDEHRHWKVCSVCGEVLESADHKAGPEATQETSQICTDCGYMFTPPGKLNWFFDRIKDSDTYLWASVTYQRIMDICVN